MVKENAEWNIFQTPLKQQGNPALCSNLDEPADIMLSEKKAATEG
jgi:hypothetical protein